MHRYALTFVSKDRPGIVAEATRVLLEKGFNIEDSSSTLLNGVFSMILLVTNENKFETDEIKSFFIPAGMKPAVFYIEKNGNANDIDYNNYIISVYGADKPGIVHHITDAMHKRGINISDLQTQVIGKAPKEIYIMILEVLVPANTEDIWQEDLKQTAKSIGTDITIRHMETYEL